ncbi:magnesium transporter CorA family protein [Loktanella sp. DJP18]|uniref:magnesium transporter CorA family protein n=1 Tax=Loktanella sp. DJP18 TaxID=3409788 RepID=UPI003BB4DC2D
MITEIELDGRARWLDLVSPTANEEAEVENVLGIDVPTQEDIKKNEPSSRHYREDGATFMAAQIVVHGETPLPQTSSVAFILKNDTLVTVRYEQSRAFDLCASEIQRTDRKPTSTSALIGLIEALVDRTSELLEGAANAADDMALSSLPFSEQPSKRRTVAELEGVLAEIQRLHRRVAKVRESLVSLGRMTGYLLTQSELDDPEFRERARSMSRDIISVTDHATFVAQNIQFVLDTLLGVISVEQNAIVKFFSIVAVVLLPPTLIAAIYGMNFETMPELTWTWGYPAALGAMLASAVLPYLWCRKRGWL